MGDGGSRTSVEGRSHSPARRSSLRSERSRAQLTARQKDHKDLPQRFALAFFFLDAVRVLLHHHSATDITARKTNVDTCLLIYQKNPLSYWRIFEEAESDRIKKMTIRKNITHNGRNVGKTNSNGNDRNIKLSF